MLDLPKYTLDPLVSLSAAIAMKEVMSSPCCWWTLLFSLDLGKWQKENTVPCPKS